MCAGRMWAWRMWAWRVWHSVCGHSVGWNWQGHHLCHATDCLPIIRNPKLPELLEYLKKAGKKIFLLTNSPYKFTNVVMKYILDDITGEGGMLG